MAYQNNYGGGNFEKFPISTSSLTFFGSDTMLLMSFSDDKCYVSFRDAVIDENGKRKYPRPANGDMKYTATLTKERALAFCRRIDNAFIPQFEAFVEKKQSDPSFNAGYSVAVPTNAEMTNMLSLSTGKPDNGYYAPEISYIKDIDMNTRIPAEVKTFVFSQKIPVFTGYDPKTGEYVSQYPEYPQLIIFKIALDEFIKGQTKGALHGIESKYHDRYTGIRNTINQIAEKNGIPIAQNNSFAKGPSPAPAQSGQVPQPVELKTYNNELNLLSGLGDPNDLPF